MNEVLYELSEWSVSVRALSPGSDQQTTKINVICPQLSSAPGTGDIWRQEPIIVLLERFGIAINLEY